MVISRRCHRKLHTLNLSELHCSRTGTPVKSSLDYTQCFAPDCPIQTINMSFAQYLCCSLKLLVRPQPTLTYEEPAPIASLASPKPSPPRIEVHRRQHQGVSVSLMQSSLSLSSKDAPGNQTGPILPSPQPSSSNSVVPNEYFRNDSPSPTNKLGMLSLGIR